MHHHAYRSGKLLAQQRHQLCEVMQRGLECDTAFDADQHVVIVDCHGPAVGLAGQCALLGRHQAWLQARITQPLGHLFAQRASNGSEGETAAAQGGKCEMQFVQRLRQLLFGGERRRLSRSTQILDRQFHRQQADLGRVE